MFPIQALCEINGGVSLAHKIDFVVPGAIILSYSMTRMSIGSLICLMAKMGNGRYWDRARPRKLMTRMT